MKKENWEEIKNTLRATLEIEPARRKIFLNAVAPNSEVRAEVESLLAFETATEDFMSMPLGDYSKDFLPSESASDAATETSFVNQKIGVYEILSELGGGGMGTVYLGRRADGKFEQKAAIKLLRREFNNDKFRRHFEREKEIQARLNHPNIARLIDAGTTADGIPFLVMEYVEGAPVDKYCRAKNLSLKERLKLFNRICEAVAAAHRSLIVHRDLKPSNILIDEAGEPKLLDFGISKILDAENSDETQTATLLGAMTPEYASPEQIKGDPITTATDIYSLGVILFKILAGDYPYDFKNKTNGKLLREITDSEPALVSEAAAKSDYEEKIPASKLKGDLDNIICKSLRKNPAERYPSVEQFAADLWRYIDGLPVQARPATFAYRTNKFIRRHRISVIAAALVFLSLIGGIAVASWQARTANAAQQQAENQSLFARQEEEKAKKNQRFYVEDYRLRQSALAVARL